MTAEIIPIKQKDHLAEVDAGLTLLKMFHRTGGHNQQTISLIMAKMTDDIQKAQEQLKTAGESESCRRTEKLQEQLNRR